MASTERWHALLIRQACPLDGAEVPRALPSCQAVYGRLQARKFPFAAVCGGYDALKIAGHDHSRVRDDECCTSPCVT